MSPVLPGYHVGTWRQVPRPVLCFTAYLTFQCPVVWEVTLLHKTAPNRGNVAGHESGQRKSHSLRKIEGNYLSVTLLRLGTNSFASSQPTFSTSNRDSHEPRNKEHTKLTACNQTHTKCAMINVNKTDNVRINVTFRGVRVTTVTVEKQY